MWMLSWSHVEATADNNEFGEVTNSLTHDVVTAVSNNNDAATAKNDPSLIQYKIEVQACNKRKLTGWHGKFDPPADCKARCFSEPDL